MTPPAGNVTIGEKHNFSWQQTMLRIKDPKVTVPFYERHFGMKLIHSYTFDEAGFSLYFLERPRDGAVLPTPGTPEAEKYLWNMKGVCLELTHNHGTEKDPNFKVNNGNEEPHRGFGHIAFNCPDVVAVSQQLEEDGVSFQKRPHEGRMKTIAFAKDPNGYWIELCNRHPEAHIPEKFNLSQTMIRVKDPKQSLAFYRDLLGMKLIAKKDKGDFTVYFLAYLEPGVSPPENIEGQEADEFIKKQWFPFLELTHNHGTETDASFKYSNGNDPPQGYGHIGMLCDNLEEACAELEAAGVKFRKRPQDGKMRGIAFVLDPDGYSVELIKRGVTF
ncbi:lactoylglutathione lyase, putative [Eimeria tenella]|uniref:Lactoylglutathione lyase n=1 Tax=Eimeria tenella TaxID=5802 RepID=U6KTF3_EIMTE|nr:lactoylglutathione lyase, putative [Eimeria tenella]CDJ39649.1 lactoylglutathione lyase, putative [Eimeria tenella]|eukprot:XP_013230404.1 lactoylglutathione lyase, putative [Eimeria tenella]